MSFELFSAPEIKATARSPLASLDRPTTAYLQYHEPPVDLRMLALVFQANGNHSAARDLHVDSLLMPFRPSSFCDEDTIEALAYDYFSFGNCYLLVHRNRIGRPVRLERLMAFRTRRLNDPAERYGVVEAELGKIIKYPVGDVIWIGGASAANPYYAEPRYLAALSACLLGEASLLFRRRYYENGGHIGALFTAIGESLDKSVVEQAISAMKKAKESGQFKTAVLRAQADPSKNQVEFKPFGELKARDEIHNVSKITRQEIYSAWRVPPELMGVIPDNVGGLGNPQTAAVVFETLKINRVIRRFLAVNTILGAQALNFSGKTLSNLLK